MQLIRKRAFARAGLAGNPSDGYHGRTIAFSLRNFWADVVLYEWDEIEVVTSQEDRSRFRTVHELAQDVRLHGYYGGIRLVKATIKKFVDYCDGRGLSLHDRNFSVRYQSSIPRQVGLAGSSAIIVATLRCLMEFYGIEIPRRVQPSLALSVETDELGIAAGLQDRVVQVYEGLIAMDFAKESMEELHGFRCGIYEVLDPSQLPLVYVAYRTDVSEPTEVVHNDLRARFDRGDAPVVQAMRDLADLTLEALRAIPNGDSRQLGALVDKNYQIRESICRIPKAQADMVTEARKAGASAKFAGSGGAIVGIYADADVRQRLETCLEAIGCQVLTPEI